MAQLIGNGIKYVYTIADPEAAYIDFQIKSGPTTIVYTGRGYPIPNTQTVVLDITEILEDNCNFNNGAASLFQSPTTSPTTFITSFVFNYTLSVKEQTQSVYTVFETDTVLAIYPDAVFNQIIVPGVTNLNMKTEYTIDTRSCKTAAFYTDSAFNIRIQDYPSGQTTEVAVPANTYIAVTAFGVPNSIGGVISKVGSPAVPLVNYNAQFCTKNKGTLYWLNRFGGIESLLITGKQEHTSQQTRLSYKKKQYTISGTTINSSASIHGDTTIKTDISKQWTLGTTFLEDTDWTWMESLYTSPMVWYQDFEYNTIESVVVTSNNFRRELFKDSGKKIPIYEIQVTSSQSKYRK